MKTLQKDAKSRNPGPGAYETNKSFVDSDSRSFTIGQKRFEKERLSPGPGTYEADKSLDSIKYRSPR